MEEEFISVPLDIQSAKGHTRTIVHIDIDCFYAQVEMIRNPALCDKPLGVQQKNIVVTCNYEARARGVTKLMAISDALKRCSDLVLVSGEDLTNYRQVSTQVTELLQSRFTRKVERLGFDENFIDITDLIITERLGGPESTALDVDGHTFGDSKVTDPCSCGCTTRLIIGSHMAADMRKQIHNEFGLTTCAGISHNKVLAKLVGSTHKPNQQTTIFPHQTLELINNLSSIRGIPGIGHQTSEKLRQHLGVGSIESLQRCSIDQLTRVLGCADQARCVQGLVFGVDDSEVKVSGKPQSVGVEDAVKEVRSVEAARERLLSLLRHLVALVGQQQGRTPGTLRLILRTRAFSHTARESGRESRQCSIPALAYAQQPDTCVDRLMPLVMELFRKIVDPAKPFHLTLLGLTVTNFIDAKKGRASILTFMKPPAKKVCLESDVMQSQTEKDCAIASASSKCDLPPDVDIDVFQQLPPDLQQEILNDWERRKVTENRKVQTKSKNSIQNYFNKK